jgi:hypothetical protein
MTRSITKRKVEDSTSYNDGKCKRSRIELAENTDTVVEPALSSMPRPEQPFRFMDLPQELQDMIDDERWREDGLNSWPSSAEDRVQEQVLLDYEDSTSSYNTGLPQ